MDYKNVDFNSDVFAMNSKLRTSYLYHAYCALYNTTALRLIRVCRQHWVEKLRAGDLRRVIQTFQSGQEYRSTYIAIVDPLKKQIDCLSDELANTEIHANENEQYSRRCNVRIHGIPEVESENCYEVVVDFFRKDLRCEVNESEIDRTHRVGKRQAGYKPRAIIVKFCSYQSKAKVMKSKTILKGKPLFVNEDLTAVNKRLFDVARRELRPLPVWSSDGKILVKLQNERVVRVKSEGDIKQYIIM